MFKLKPEVSDLLWRLKDIEGMSRSEIVERAIIRLACEPTDRLPVGTGRLRCNRPESRQDLKWERI